MSGPEAQVRPENKKEVEVKVEASTPRPGDVTVLSLE